jgi:hypothetical protein
MILDEIESLAFSKKNRKRQLESERLYWLRIHHSVGKARVGLLGRPFHYRHATEEDACLWALNCALLINGLSPSWVPLSNRKTVAEIKKKVKTLPRSIHNWMLLASPNEWTKGYVCLLEGKWKVSGPETRR